ncbi:PREDICTED: zinc finger MYM-type protein 3 isoform X2 [Papilio polytes]|uniref:zinc finger MYM-type protein 3 isoform X2 n=1 Tax=Papilio polytes TaxID=76194 RepID=UPI0006768AD4|nr:PREDICTED: zinc finger MYM-type protein 3 isoform X2 [Papilio polytes]
MDNDEKVPTVLECRPKDDGDGTSNVDDDSKETETAIDENITSENVKSDLKELESDLDSVSDLGITNEPPNHVDHLPSDKEGCVQNSLSSETDNIVPLGNEESSTVEQENKEESEEVDNEINEMSTIDRSNDTENENIPQTPSESVSQDSIDSQIEETEKQEEKMDKEGITDIKEESTGLQEENTDVIEQRTDSQESTDTQDEKADSNEMSEKTDCVDNDGDEKKDEVGKPEFETAPNISIDEPQDDHTQALDPFDTLLREQNDSVQETSETATQATVNVLDEDDDNDDYNADNPVDEDDEHNAEDVSLEDSVAELGEEPGADEEVCLLPDTEREISEADKAEAEKVLAEKRKQAEAAASELAEFAELAEESEPKKESETEVEKENDNTEEATNSEAGDAGLEVEDEHDDPSQENGDKENENEESGDASSYVLNTIQEIEPKTKTCFQCNVEKDCIYHLPNNEDKDYICSEDCLKSFLSESPTQAPVADSTYVVEEINPESLTCSECEENKTCYFYYKLDGEDTNYCSINCLHSMMADEQDKYVIKRRKIVLTETKLKKACFVCHEKKKSSFSMSQYGITQFICDQACVKNLNDSENGRYVLVKKRPVPKVKQTNTSQMKPPLLKLKVISNATDKYLDEAYKVQNKTPAMIQAAKDERQRTFLRSCTQCYLMLTSEERMLTWETMDFCNEVCLGRYQNKIGARCANCNCAVQHTSLGKYCVRFGYDIRQFCNSTCLEEFKKSLKICCYCQKDISAGLQGFLAPVGDKGQFKDFCSQLCVEKFDHMSKNPVPAPVWAKCAVCALRKATTIEVEISDGVSQRLCSDPCFAAFKFVNHIFPDQCCWCKKYFERKIPKSFTIYENSSPQCFCTKSCMNVYISNSRHIVPCNWCKVKKYNFDMIRRVQTNGQIVLMCSLNCLNLYQVSVNAVSSRRTKCDMCKRTSLAQYHLTMSDATVRNFCTYQCVMSFQGQYAKHPPLVSGEALEQTKAVPTGAPRRTYPSSKNAAKNIQRNSSSLPVISNVQSLAPPQPAAAAASNARSKLKRSGQAPLTEPEPTPRTPSPPPPPPKPLTPPPPPPPKVYNHVIVKTLPPNEVANKATMTKPMMVSKGVSCRPHPCTKECQTDSSLERKILIPIPVPIYVPVPCAMWSLPFPIPVPIPLPIPTPVFIPTTRNSAKGIMKEINKIHDKMPTDPFEAELLMMAEMVAGDKKKDHSDSDTDDDNEDTFSPVAGIDGNNAFGEDMLQMALKMATEYEDQPVDLESAMTANTITPSSHPGLEGESMHAHQMMVLEQQRAVAALRATAPRKRAPAPEAAPPPARATRSKRRRADPAPPPPEPPREPVEKPDANMCLKYTFGVNAWKQWVMTKNAEIEKSSIRRKPFKSEILQLTADELNYSLCLFVKEVRKPNGSEYAPDTIYYLVLGIQQYLFENGRIDNIFTDPYYEKFTDCLDEVARKFSVLYNDSQYIVTRVEEEHLWESKQLGAHSPHVLLSTLMFFNTKHFNLVTVDEHMQLSFSHIMKHWKRNPNQPGQAKMPGSRNVLLRFYPPQSALEANSRKKKVYEQQENEDNPLRCPVKLYEFYISKCPESVRTRNDVFYLQPERSCVPDSPVWYSTQPLSRAALAKMLHRVKMVKEINIALLTS